VSIVPVETAKQMAEAVEREAGTCDVVIMAAAVADFRPADPRPTKLRRAEGPPRLELEPTVDILDGLGSGDGGRPFIVGFAAETGPAEGARAKAARADLTVANDVTAAGSGFGTDTNQVTVFDAQGNAEKWPLLSKDEVAGRLLDIIQREAARRS
jgi:phosphopantothenoylcysteine decarboxylase/phosphopantothenate--cysteine ligase